MLFNSISYLLFFPLIFAAYWLSPRSVRRPLLLIASYFFYMSWLPIYGLMLVCLTAANYLFGLAINRWRKKAKQILIEKIKNAIDGKKHVKQIAF